MRNRIACYVLMGSICARGYSQEPTTAAAQDEGGLRDKLWLSGQVNVVTQFHPAFHASYSGPNSLRQQREEATTWVATLYTGYALTKNTEFLFDLESARGAGVSGALGLGGLGDLDAVTDHTASAKPYVARIQIRHIISLGGEMTASTRSPLGLATTVPAKRIEIRLGKMSLTDFFDLNSVGSDSHLQFLNYSIDNNAVYDVAANSRGYTYGVLAELYHPKWTARFAEAFEPTDTSGLKTQWDLTKGRSENFEFEVRPELIAKRSSVFRALMFINHADMASYPDAVSAYLNGKDGQPDLTLHIKPNSIDYGFGLNGEQELKDYLRVFGRAGWNANSKEAFQFAEADQTIAFGGDIDGKKWGREGHRAGIAVASNALTRIHRHYLELGGSSYLLGDGALQYGRETTLEGYYNVPLFHGVYASLDVQRVWNPGYNQSRGPVIVFGVRLHLESDVHFK